MEFRSFRAEDIDAASLLLAGRHRAERRAFPALKREFEDGERARKSLADIFEGENASGVCAYARGRLLGYILANIETEGLLGRCAYARYEGLAVAEGESPELYRALYARAAKAFVGLGALSHYAEIPAGDPKAVDAWLRLSFAYQQVYAVTTVSEKAVATPEGVTVRLANEQDSEPLRGIANLICAYQAGAPVYAAMTPERLKQIREGYAKLPEDEEAVTFLAYEGDRLVGFLSADIGGDDSAMMLPEKAFEISICGTVPARRGAGIGCALTGAAMNWAVQKGYEHAIADWRIANLLSSNFWPKRGFIPYAYRMFRKIDERVYWANGGDSETQL